MRANFNKLDRREKRRIIIFTVIAVLEAVFAVAYVCEWCRSFKEQLIRTDNIDVNIDGGNFNWFFGSLASGLNGSLMLFSAVAYVVFLTVIDLLACGIFKVFAFRKTGFVSEDEYILAKCVLTIILIVSIVISFFIARFNFLLFIALLIFPIWLFGYLFYILPLKHKSRK